MNNNFFDEMDSEWSDLISDVYSNNSISNTLVKYDINKYGINNFKEILYFNEYLYKNRIINFESNEIELIIKVNDINLININSNIYDNRATFEISLNNISIFINKQDITEYITNNNYIDKILSITFLPELKTFMFSGIDIGYDTYIGNIDLCVNNIKHTMDNNFNNCVTYLNFKMFKSYMGNNIYNNMINIFKHNKNNITIE